MNTASAPSTWRVILQGILISLAMGIAVYLFLGLFSGIASSTRWWASVAFLAFGLGATTLIGINGYLSRRQGE